MAGGGGGGGGMMRWLITYADLITLLMVFFVVMFAMAEVDKQKYARLALSLRTAFGGSGLVNLPAEAPEGIEAESRGWQRTIPDLDPGTGGAGDGDAGLVEVGRRILAELQPYGRFHVFLTERGLVISLTGSAFFDTGKATLRPESRRVLDVIARHIRDLPNDISVEGSADDRPIRTAEFPSNWELSARRATEVVRYFIEHHGIDPRRFIAVGYAEVRPLFDNATEEGRARNRRVDVVILRDRHVIAPLRELQPPPGGSPPPGR